jgi:nitroreductase
MSMELWHALRSRHSVRDFTDEPVSREALERVVAAASLAPSSRNEQPWKFYVITGETRKEVGTIIAQTTIHLSDYMEVLGQAGYEDAVTWYSSLGDAPALIAVASPASDEALLRLNRHLSVGAAVENMLLACVGEGLAACNITFSHWVEDELADKLGLPEDWEILTVIAVGFPGSNPPLAPAHSADVAVWLD